MMAREISAACDLQPTFNEANEYAENHGVDIVTAKIELTRDNAGRVLREIQYGYDYEGGDAAKIRALSVIVEMLIGKDL